MSWGGSPQRPRGWAPPYGYGGSAGWGTPPPGFRPPGYGGSPGQQRPPYGGWGGYGVSILSLITSLQFAFIPFTFYGLAGAG